ncbi:MAG: hypothetical protein EOO73_26335 [Myxococcales bacterium]|nr:MAG: hypothetical protein EOO73_26335 [Myxococcales bacterium]
MLAANAPFRAALLSGAAAVALSACGSASASAPPAQLVGVSDAPPDAPRAPAPAALPRQVWPELDAARAWPEAGPAVVSLAHRRDGSLVHVRVDPPTALPAYLALAAAAPMPEGARVLAWHETPAGQVVDGYLLEKRGGAWSAAVIDARGALVTASQSACLRCHDMAPADHLFGRRSPPPPASSAVESIGAAQR